MYWKRALYFWGFISVVFIGFFSLETDGKYFDFYPSLLSGSGFVLSIAWVLVNKGSKFWQKNWEKHIDLLEDEYEGRLYKTVLLKDKISYSVSEINLSLSYFITLIWFILFIHSATPFAVNFYYDDLIELHGLLLVILAATVGVLSYAALVAIADDLKSDFDKKTPEDIAETKHKHIERPK